MFLLVYFELNDDDPDWDMDGNTFVGANYKQTNNYMKCGMDITREANPKITIYPNRLRFYDNLWIDIEVYV